MARAGKENQCGFSVLPAATLLENGKLGDRQLHIFYNTPLFALKILHFQFLLGKLQYPEEIRNKVYVIYVIYLFIWGGGEGEKQTRCIMGNVQMANSFHLNTETPSPNYRQRNAFQIKGFV